MSTKAAGIDPGFSARIAYIDVLRGIAVVSMIWMHTADGWLDPSLRTGSFWRGVVSFGGLAAPLFFALAGVGLGMAWHGLSTERLEARLQRQIDRGLQVLVLGYALRLQMWMVDAGGFATLANWPGVALLALGYGLAHRALAKRSPGRPRALLSAAAICVAGLLAVALVSLSSLPRLLRVDVLQGLGAAMVAVCLSCRGLLRRGLLNPTPLVVVALLVPFAVSPLRASLPGPLPQAVAGYLAAWPIPKGASAATLFPMFPWMAYTFGGAAFAMFWNRANADKRGNAALTRTCVAGVVVAVLVSEFQPWTYAITQAWPVVTQPVRVLYRAAIACALCLPALWIGSTRFGKALAQLGSASLWVYWVHLEFAFGLAAHPFVRSLNVMAWLAGFLLLTLAMLGLAIAVNAQVGSTLLRRFWSPRPSPEPEKRPPQPVRGP